ncbi:PREDICTED: uncharacterized protein LOC106111395 [Papilio polytes]|uniref:uncharacterized protein LOC106111395 n=1 Tax=Papilio polytes TaxID=76194 RepID=UPI0006768D44|nr:PREDICTED: uncharacterized protein LOC106111395 [Papilio polytes]
MLPFNYKLDLKLIELVKENPALYDPNSAKYLDCNAREVAWQKIGDKLQKPAAKCKVRWNHIRLVFRRILKKPVSDSEPPKVYKYEKQLAFIRPLFKDITAPTIDYESDTDVKDDTVNDRYDDESRSEIEDTPQKKIIKRRIPKPITKAKMKRYEEEKMSVSPSEVTTPACDFDRSDPVDAFLLSVGATLKTFSPYHLNIAKTKIFNVVQEHDLQQIWEKTRSDESVPETPQKYLDYTH